GGRNYSGAVETDRYGRKTPKMAHGSINLGEFTSSTRLITAKVLELYDRIVDKKLTVRRMYVVANHVTDESLAPKSVGQEAISIFDDPEQVERKSKTDKAAREKERKLQETEIILKRRFGKNAIIKGMNLEEGATTIDRNKQVGGHRSGE
ncbi:MAG: hypothetical protein J6V48_08730, partial [Clostridia bacterium]|nr:hypothetical protein [Clostridia bacterium]